MTALERTSSGVTESAPVGENLHALNFLKSKFDHIAQSALAAMRGEDAYTVGRLGLVMMSFPEQLKLYLEQKADSEVGRLTTAWQKLVEDLTEHAKTATEENKFLHQQPNRALAQRINDLIRETDKVLLDRYHQPKHRLSGLMELLRQFRN